MIQHLLYATDLSVFNTYLLQQAYQMAAQNQPAKISIVHAVQPLGVFADAIIDTYVPQEALPFIKYQGMPALMEAIGDQVLDSLKVELNEGAMDLNVIQDIIVERGDAAAVILDAATRLNVDMIIMGSCGNHSEGPLLGSVVTKVLQLSHVPVLMVPTGQTSKTRKAMRKLAS